MKQKHCLSKSLFLAATAFVSCNALSAPGILEDLPLNISTTVQPNIFFLLDDSGSMDWEVLKSAGARTGVYAGNPDSGNIDITPTPSDLTELLESCAFYNVMYYDPSQTYTPWVGTDINGVAYADQDPTAARANPYDPSINVPETGTPTINLVTRNDGFLGIPGYIPFSDVNNNGVFDVGDCGDGGAIADMYANFVSVASMSPAERVNFANWYSYYRKREYVAKRALSEIIDDSESRMGLATLHNNSLDGNGVGTIIQDMQNSIRKRELLESLFNADSSGLTPLRQNLEQVGQYFEEGVGAPTGLFGFTPNHSSGETVSVDSPIFNEVNGGVCQQNFSVVFSDGFWNGGNPSVGDQDSDSASLYDGGWFADTYLAANPSAISDTLADVAMYYLKEDLSSTLSNDSNVTDVRDASQTITHQHLTTYTVAFGLNGNLSVNPSDTNFPGWTDPTDAEDRDRIDDMRHAAWNGRGEFLSANDPQELISTLTSAVEDIADRVGTATAASFSSGRINSDTLVFQSVFSTEDWSGDLLTYRFGNDGIIDNDGSGVIDFGDAVWSASSEVALQGSRSIMTFNGTQGVPFVFPSPYSTLSTTTLSSEQIEDLLTNAPFSSSTVDTDEIAANQVYGEALVSYLKGDDSNEVNSSGIGMFRSRDGNPLGSFIHSSPQYVGVPNDKYPNFIESGNPYDDFSQARAGRTPVVYVGGNDGMLHGFDASLSGGEEIFAYIPSFLVNNLHVLSEADYSHLAYVDSTPTVRDVFVNGAWRTYLVGGARSGGRGIYVLDVTDPSALADADNADSVVQFEFIGDLSLSVDSDPNAGGDADLGYTYSRPQIAKMNDGSWVAIVANGYNSEGDGTAKLFIIDLETGETRELDTGAGNNDGGSCLDNDGTGVDGDPASDCNGLSSPAIADLNGDFLVDRIYAGDLHGNMWVFNVSDTNPANWGVAFGGQPLFSACTGSPCGPSNRQPITVKPELRNHPNRRSFATSPNVLVYFGTGQFIAEDDELDTSTQSFYAVWDAGSSSSSSTYGSLDRGDLQQQAFTNASGTIGVTSNDVDYLVSSDFGWYIDLNVPTGNIFSGGRVVINPLLIDELIFFIVTVPSGAACNRDGDAYLVVLDNYAGAEADFAIFDTDGDGIADSSSPVDELEDGAVGLGSLGTSDGGIKLVINEPDGGFGTRDPNTRQAIVSGRKSWSILK